MRLNVVSFLLREGVEPPIVEGSATRAIVMPIRNLTDHDAIISEARNQLALMGVDPGDFRVTNVVSEDV